MDLFNTAKIERLEVRIEELEGLISSIIEGLIKKGVLDTIDCEDCTCEPKREGKEL